MKRFFYILLFVFTITLAGCSNKKLSPILFKDSQIKSADSGSLDYLGFNIDKIFYSKSYQNITPQVEIIKQGLDHKILASFGLVNSSGIEIEKISKNNNEIDIFISNKSNYITNELVVPQAVIDIFDIPSSKLDKYKFNIHNLNYKPLKIKLDANEAINIVNSNSQIITNTYPSISITKHRSKYYWNLEYYNIFDKAFKDSPLINLTAKINANTGEIVETNKIPISNYVDKGILFDSLSSEYLIYKKTEPSQNDDSVEILWSYNIKTHEKTNLFTSDGKIISASFSPDNKHLVLLESGEKSNRAYLIKLSESKAYRINFENSFNPEIIKWKDNNNIYIVHKNENRSIISNYDVDNDDFKLMLRTKKDIIDFEVYKDYFLITEKQNDDNTSYICLSRDLKDSIYKDFGYSGKFINKNQFAYIKDDSQNDKSQLFIFDFSKDKLLEPLDYNISNYTILSESSLALIEKNQNNRVFNLYKYDLDNKESYPLTDMLSDKTVLNLYENTLYLNANLPFEEKEPHIIYAIDISQLSNTQP